jgi:hypothetical protein
MYEWTQFRNQVAGSEPADQADQADEWRATASRDLLLGNLGHAVLKDRQQIEQVLVVSRLLPIEVEVERLGNDVRTDGGEEGLGLPTLTAPPFVEGGECLGEERGVSESLQRALCDRAYGRIGLAPYVPLERIQDLERKGELALSNQVAGDTKRLVRVVFVLVLAGIPFHEGK